VVKTFSNQPNPKQITNKIERQRGEIELYKHMIYDTINHLTSRQTKYNYNI
jgi:hypothetical protein